MGDPDRVGVNIPGHREAVIVMGNRQAVDTRLSLVCLDTRAAGNVSPDNVMSDRPDTSG